MAIFQYTDDSIRELLPTNFQSAGITERGDLQRLLRDQIEIVAPDCLVIHEEFGDWEDSKRRIDLLAIDSNANLVVIELKRTDDGGHMELQALRYAAMVSTMTFERAVSVYAAYQAKRGMEHDAEASMLEFLNWEEPDDEMFAADVRIVLVSADFSRELTTAVMWLADRDIDIRCIRLKPYDQDGQILLDVQQIIPLPEAEEFQIQIREKERQERKNRSERFILRKQFWTDLLAHARTKTNLHNNITAGEYNWIGTGSGHRGLLLVYNILKDAASVELYIDRGKNCGSENIEIFKRLSVHRQQIDSAFGEPLEWSDIPGKRACKIRTTFIGTGYRSDASKWPALIEQMVDAMIRLERALSPHLADTMADLNK